jgi:hypothetical protein
MWVEFGHLYLEAPRTDVVQPRPFITSLSQLCNTTNMFYYKQGCHVLQFYPRASVAGIGEQIDFFILIAVEQGIYLCSLRAVVPNVEHSSSNILRSRYSETSASSFNTGCTYMLLGARSSVAVLQSQCHVGGSASLCTTAEIRQEYESKIVCLHEKVEHKETGPRRCPLSRLLGPITLQHYVIIPSTSRLAIANNAEPHLLPS